MYLSCKLSIIDSTSIRKTGYFIWNMVSSNLDEQIRNIYDLYTVAHFAITFKLNLTKTALTTFNGSLWINQLIID